MQRFMKKGGAKISICRTSWEARCALQGRMGALGRHMGMTSSGGTCMGTRGRRRRSGIRDTSMTA